MSNNFYTGNILPKTMNKSEKLKTFSYTAGFIQIWTSIPQKQVFKNTRTQRGQQQVELDSRHITRVQKHWSTYWSCKKSQISMGEISKR